jgi:hypothetical protein
MYSLSLSLLLAQTQQPSVRREQTMAQTPATSLQAAPDELFSPFL